MAETEHSSHPAKAVNAVNEPKATSPAEEMAAPVSATRTSRPGQTRLRELPWCGKINLRGDPTDAQFLRLVEDALTVALPLEANTTTTGKTANGDLTLFWLGPDEWQLHCELAHTETLLARLAQHLAPVHHALTEVTDYYAVLELTGAQAAAVLARGCPLDLHDRHFPATHCAQSRFGTASVLLHKVDPDQCSHMGGDQPIDQHGDLSDSPHDTEPSFIIQVRWSFTAYLWAYLTSVIDSLP